MRHRVAIMFCELESIALSQDELITHEVSDQKLDSLNDAFVKMTKISTAFGGGD